MTNTRVRDCPTNSVGYTLLRVPLSLILTGSTLYVMFIIVSTIIIKYHVYTTPRLAHAYKTYTRDSRPLETNSIAAVDSKLRALVPSFVLLPHAP